MARRNERRPNPVFKSYPLYTFTILAALHGCAAILWSDAHSRSVTRPLKNKAPPYGCMVWRYGAAGSGGVRTVAGPAAMHALPYSFIRSSYQGHACLVARHAAAVADFWRWPVTFGQGPGASSLLRLGCVITAGYEHLSIPTTRHEGQRRGQAAGHIGGLQVWYVSAWRVEPAASRSNRRGGALLSDVCI